MGPGGLDEPLAARRLRDRELAVLAPALSDPEHDRRAGALLSFRLHYEGTELVIRSGIIFRNERHVPYARIQNLDAIRNVAHRLLGVTEVRVETGGGQAPEATISVLHETVFEEMRRRIFEGRTRAGQADVEQVEAPEPAAAVVESPPLLHLPLRELFLNGLLDNRGSVLVATTFGVLWEAGLMPSLWNQVSTGWFAPGMIRDTVRTVAAGRFPPPGRIALIIVAIMALLLFVRVLSMIWSAMRLYEFRLSRVGEDLRTEYGLLTRVTATIPLRRVQTMTIREAPLQRLVERMSVRVETAGGHAAPGNTSKQPREWLAPIIRRAAVPALVREVLPGIELDALDWQPLHPRAFRRAVKPAVLLALLPGLPFVFWFGWGGLDRAAVHGRLAERRDLECTCGTRSGPPTKTRWPCAAAGCGETSSSCRPERFRWSAASSRHSIDAPRWRACASIRQAARLPLTGSASRISRVRPPAICTRGWLHRQRRRRSAGGRSFGGWWVEAGLQTRRPILAAMMKLR